MNLLDIIILAMIVFLFVRGIFRGFFREIGSVAGVVLGIWLANLYQPRMTEYLKEYIPSSTFLPLISFGFIFLIVVVLCNLAGWSLRTISKKTSLGWADRTLGAGLAILKGIIITYLAIVLLTFFVPSKTPLISRSRLTPLIISSYQSIVSIVSPGFYQKWKERFLKEKERMDGVASNQIKGLTQ
jgi:membrane protein required for colicin V production